MPGQEGEVSGVVAVPTADGDRDGGTEGGARLPEGRDGRDGEVLVEVKQEAAAGESEPVKERSGLTFSLCVRVSWRRARGVISTDNALFSRWDAPQLDRVVLDAVREDDAGKRTEA